MPRQYEKLSKHAKRVSFDDSARFNFEAPRQSRDERRSLDTPYHAPENNRDDSEDEIDNLLAEDPLYDEKEASRKRRAPGSRMGRRKRRAIIFGSVTLLLGIIAALVLVGLHTHAKVKGTASSSESGTDLKDAEMTSDIMTEIQDMTEVPSLAGVLPLKGHPSPIMPVPVSIPVDEETIISVPSTDINWDSEEEDRIAYEAEAAKGGEVSSSGPPELSTEAISQAQALNGQLDEASAAVAVTAEDSASKIQAHKGDPVQQVKDAAAEFWAWLDATWADLVGNSPDSDETLY